MEQNPYRLEEMPPDILAFTLKKKRFEMLTPIFASFLFGGLVLGMVAMLNGLDGLPLVFGVLTVVVVVHYLRCQKFLEWESRFTKRYRVGGDYWLPSRSMFLRPIVKWLLLGACVGGVIVSWGSSRNQRLTVSFDAPLEGFYVCLDQGDIAYESENYAEALQSYEQALQMVRDAGDTAHEGFILDCIGRVYTRQEAYPKAVSCFEEALAIVRAEKDGSGEAIILIDLGVVYYNQGLYRQTSDYLTQASNAVPSKDSSTRATIAIYQARVALMQEKYNSALLYARTVRQLCPQEAPDCESVSLLLMGQAYLGWDEPEAALDYLEHALELAQTAGSEDLMQEIQDLITYISEGENQR